MILTTIFPNGDINTLSCITSVNSKIDPDHPNSVCLGVDHRKNGIEYHYEIGIPPGGKWVLTTEMGARVIEIAVKEPEVGK